MIVTHVLESGGENPSTPMGVTVGISGIRVGSIGVLVSEVIEGSAEVSKTDVGVGGLEVYVATGVHDTKIIVTIKRHNGFIFILTLPGGQPPNGLRYPLVGGTRQRRFNGTNFKPRTLLENAQTPTSRVVG